MNVEYTDCPDCHSKIPVYSGYITWCECGYNLHAVKSSEKKKKRIENIYDKLGEKNGRLVFTKMINEINIKSRISLAKGLSFLIATIVHFFSLGLLLLGIYLLCNYQYVGYIILGLILLALSWLTRPRVGKLNRNERIVPRDSLPELYSMMDKLSQQMGIKKIDGIVLNYDYNASITKIGWKRKTVVQIGLPLFASLTPEEQCSIMAHELGHYVNKDLTSGFYVWTALNTLAEWYNLLDPSQHHLEYTIFDILTKYFMKILSFFPYFLFYILLHLNWNDSQKGEYLADYRAAEICGSATTIKALEKVHWDDIYFYTLSNVSLSNEKRNVIDEFRNNLYVMPEREKLRRKLCLKNEKFKLNATHPPTIFRIKFIEKQQLQGAFIIKPEQARKMAEELDKFKEFIHDKAVDDYRYYELG